jgi:2-hydroxy-3-keto-5-methylthiopentenyl-1-phosphate phosphatase
LPAIATYKQQNADGSVKMTTTSEAAFKTKLHPITLNFDNGKLKDVFDQIVKQMENYKWEINNGVINIIPVKGRDERFEKLLGLHIERFTFEKGKTVEDITTNIMLLPEFRSFMKESNLHFYGIRTGVSFVIKAQYGKTVDEEMNFSNLTFRELLNKITKIKRGGWILKWRFTSKKTGQEYIDIDI